MVSKIKMKTFPVLTCFILTVAGAVLPLSIAVPTSAVSLAQRSSRGEPCNRTSRCDSRAWLGCFNGVCDCMKQDEMIFQESIQKCVSKSGERCKFAVDAVEDNNFMFEVTACVANATCSLEGICTCGSKFFENENGTCSLAFGHQEPCDSSPQCSQYQALECQDGLCQCNKAISIYSDTAKEPPCVGLAEKQCVNSLCTEGATCSGNKCRCNASLYANEEGLCVPKIKLFRNCTATNQCEQERGQKLVCLNGKCNCDPKISIYDTSIESSDTDRYRSQCVGLADSPCLDSRCTANAFCSYSDDIYHGYERGCKCQNNFAPSKRGTCATGYESLCSILSTCIDDLVCRNSQCLCPYVTQSFDNSTKSCLSQVGGPCTANSSCEGTAECKILNGIGHCACKTGYLENSTGKCQGTYATECSPATDCDTLASLQCINKKCKCPTFAEYSSKLRKCVGLSGAKCDVNKNSELECTENSTCKASAHPLIPGTCTCISGFIETSNYTCAVVGPVNS